MGLFSSSPKVRETSSWGRVEWEGRCSDCGKKRSDAEKSRAIRKLEDCARQDKKDREQQAKQDARDQADRDRKQAREEEAEAKYKAKQDERRATRDRQRQVDQLQSKRQATARELRRAAKGKKCPHCGKDPCKKTKPRCAAKIAERFESSMNIDVSDPATFNDQMKFYRDGKWPE